jgi:hypothetical protein
MDAFVKTLTVAPTEGQENAQKPTHGNVLYGTVREHSPAHKAVVGWVYWEYCTWQTDF